MIHCIYHDRDLDGITSAAIVQRLVPGVALHGMDYGDKVPWDAFGPDDTVWVVDFCPDTGPCLATMPNMRRLVATVARVIWCDHHATALNGAAAAGLNPPGMRGLDHSGCELTWMTAFPDAPMPRAVHLLGRYDIHDRTDPDALPFQQGMQALGLTPESKEWQTLLAPPDDPTTDMLVRQLTLQGLPILKWQEQYWLRYFADNAYPVEFEGQKGLALNVCPPNGSRCFEDTPSAKDRPLWVTFGRCADGTWKLSFHAPSDSDVDCAAIATRHGGGGHDKAAGAVLDSLPDWVLTRA